MNWLAREIGKAPRWLKILALLIWIVLILLWLLSRVASGFRERAGALSGIFSVPAAQQQTSEIGGQVQPVPGEQPPPAPGEQTQPQVRTIVVYPGHLDPTPDPAAASPVPTSQVDLGTIIDSIFGGGTEPTAEPVATTTAPAPEPTILAPTEVSIGGGIIRFNPELMSPGALREGETGGCLTGLVVLSNPVEGVKVSVALGADDRWAEVDRETGEYRICGLPDGTWRTLVVEVPGRETDFTAGVEVLITSGTATTVNWYEAPGF